MEKRILIVDDAIFMRKLLRNIVEKEGYVIVGEAGNGEEAFEKYRELEPDIVTMDITMPKIDGIEALKNIVEYDKYAKIIMCSAMGQRSMVLEALKNGAIDFIVKPFKPDVVLRTLDKIT